MREIKIETITVPEHTMKQRKWIVKCDSCGGPLSDNPEYAEQEVNQLEILLNGDSCVNFIRHRDYCTACVEPIWAAINKLINGDPDRLGSDTEDLPPGETSLTVLMFRVHVVTIPVTHDRVPACLMQRVDRPAIRFPLKQVVKVTQGTYWPFRVVRSISDSGVVSSPHLEQTLFQWFHRRLQDLHQRPCLLVSRMNCFSAPASTKPATA